MNGYPCFMDISLQLSMLLWISIWISLDFMDIHALTCYVFSIQGMLSFALRKRQSYYGSLLFRGVGWNLAHLKK